MNLPSARLSIVALMNFDNGTTKSDVYILYRSFQVFSSLAASQYRPSSSRALHVLYPRNGYFICAPAVLNGKSPNFTTFSMFLVLSCTANVAILDGSGFGVLVVSFVIDSVG